VILLTGGTGFVGRHVLARLTASGRPVRVLSRKVTALELPTGASAIVGDLADAASLGEALRGVQAVVHAAALLPGPQTTEAQLEVINGEGTGRLAALAAQAGVRRFVHLSSAGVYGDRPAAGAHAESDPLLAESAYQRSKRASELALAKALEGTPVSWTVLRPAGLYGADRPATQAFFREVATRRIWLHGPAPVRVHPTHIDDLTSAVALVIDREDLHREAINIGGDRPVSYRDLIALIGARVGHVPFQLAAPVWTRAVVSRVGNGTRVHGLTARLTRGGVDSAVDIGKARRILGFAPVRLESGLERTAAALRAQGMLPR